MERFATESGPPEPVDAAATGLIEQVRDPAMFLVDRHGRIASWNEGVRRILGWEKGDWLGQPVAVAFTPEAVQAGVHLNEMRVATTSGRADDDRWMQRRDGTPFFALGALSRVDDEHGELIGFLKVLRDFTAGKQAADEREALLAAESAARARAEQQAASLDAAIEAMADGLWLGDADGMTRCNPAALAMLGLDSAQSLVGDAAASVRQLRLRRERGGPLLPPDELPFVQALAGARAVAELWATRPDDGQDVWLRIAAAPIRVGPAVVGAVAVQSDLGEKLLLRQTDHALSRIESVLHERSAELRALLDGVCDYAIFTVGLDGHITSWHEGAALMKGYSAEEAIGMPFANLFTPEGRAAGRPEHEMAVAADSGEYKGEGQRLRKDGSVFDAAVVLTALRDPRGKLLGYLKLTQDISERRRQERERDEILRNAQAARADAERASHYKNEFLATLSHELRTPLSAILGWAHVLERGVFDPATVQHGLSAISRNARTQVQLIEDLLDMNRIESGQLRLDLQRIEPGGVIAAAIDAALPAATAKHIVLRTAFDAQIGEIAGDAVRLQQVVANLLNNAIKFTPEGGRVSVTLTRRGGDAVIAVADTGQGIAPEFLLRMFDRFQQQDATITRRQGGLGIGLAIVQQLVALHGGTVQASSPGVGQGAVLTVSLPVLPVLPAAPMLPAALTDGALPQPAAGTAPTPRPVLRLDGLCVLLIEDEADVRAITMRVLQQAGARVLPASSAEEGLRLLQRERPAVMLSDIGMPQQDGYELMRRVRALPDAAGGHTPAAAFTAYARPEDRVQALDAGYQMHLSKPVLPEILVAAVAELAGHDGA